MNTKLDKTAEGTQTDKRKTKKASTNELPMIDLDTVLGFVDQIEGGGLQTLSQQEVAKRLNYASQTSTPFYRRIVAAKLFGLLDTTQGVNLTKLALDHFKPTDEESKKQALATAVKNVVGYQGLVERFSGKRLPPQEILKNFIERQFDLTSDTASACAEVFMRSVNRAGLVNSDGTLSGNVSGQEASKMSAESTSTQGPPSPSNALTTASDDSESHYLTLDAKRNRRVIVQAPPIITSSELKRIQNWLAVQLHVIESFESEKNVVNASSTSGQTVET
jgi:hypothetical protein